MRKILEEEKLKAENIGCKLEIDYKEKKITREGIVIYEMNYPF